jgi:hypothetical protein
MILIAVSMLSVALHNPSIIIHQQNALAQINDTIFKTYENSTYGILMQYPSDWKKVEPSPSSQTSNFNIIVGFLSPKESAFYRSPPAALSIGIQNLSPSQSITVDQYSGAQINFIRQQARVLESNTVDLKGNNNTLAHKIVYINNEGQKVMQVWTIKGNKAYHITYAANETRYADYLPPVQKMIDSFKIVSLTEFNDNNSIKSITKSNSTGSLLSSSSAADGYTTTTKTTGAGNATASSDFNFAAGGDWGCTDDTTDTVNNILEKSPELVLGLGDYSYGEEYGEDSEKCWFDITKPIDGIMKIAIGNHDTGADLEALMNHFGLTEQYYSFDYQNVHFIALGTEKEYLDMSNDKAKEQLAFVQSDLKKASSNPNIDWIIPFFHRMMYAREPSSIVDSYDHNIVDIYHPLFEKYGVHLVLQGHSHSYERTYPLRYNPEGNIKNPIITSKDSSNNYRNVDGLVIATVGTGGAFPTILHIVPEYIAVGYKNLFGFLNVDVSADGKTLVGTFYDTADGEIKDRFTITKSSETATPIDDSIGSGGGGEDSGDSDGG